MQENDVDADVGCRKQARPPTTTADRQEQDNEKKREREGQRSVVCGGLAVVVVSLFK